MSDATRPERETISLSVDVAVLTVRGGALQVLLIRRGNPPFQGRWALPGGFVDPGEAVEAAAIRELEEETAMKGLAVEQLGTWGDPGRDPRGRTVSVVYLAACPSEAARAVAGDDATEVGWFPLREPPEMAFDHGEILEAAWRRCLLHLDLLGGWLFRLLPERFPLARLHEVFRALDVPEGVDESTATMLLDTGGIVPVEGEADLFRLQPEEGLPSDGGR